MGTSYSIVQQLSREEQEERDYARLVEAVEAAQTAQLQFGQSSDAPAPYGLQDSHPQASAAGRWHAPAPYQLRHGVQIPPPGFVPPSSTLGLLDRTFDIYFDTEIGSSHANDRCLKRPGFLLPPRSDLLRRRGRAMDHILWWGRLPMDVPMHVSMRLNVCMPFASEQPSCPLVKITVTYDL